MAWSPELSLLFTESSNVSKACQTLDDDEKDVGKADTLGGSQDMMLISESGLYTLVMRSNKPEAKVFRKWVSAISCRDAKILGLNGVGVVTDVKNLTSVTTCRNIRQVAIQL